MGKSLEFFFVFYFGIAVLLLFCFAAAPKWRSFSLVVLSVFLTAAHVLTLSLDPLEGIGSSRERPTLVVALFISYGLTAIVASALANRGRSVLVVSGASVAVASLAFITSMLIGTIHLCNTHGCM